MPIAGIAKSVSNVRVKIYDTTLRDGSQGEHISFSVEDKLRIARRLDELGLHYIEGGWPGSNPKDAEFFERARELQLKRARLVAFGSTRRAKKKVGDDPNIRELLKAGTPTVCIFGKSWDLQVRDALGVSLQQNLEMIRDSVAYLKAQGREVIYDAEHFFDAYKHNREYAMETVRAAEGSGADYIVLCDTNGGSMPYEVREIVEAVRKEVKAPLGIHAHNDSETAVANSVTAVRAGATMVQGTINGYGERCGNANLCSIIPNLELKLGIRCLDGNLRQLTEVSRFVSEIANLSPAGNMPYVGQSAFAHKGGIHVSAVEKNPETYEHVKPETVGNSRRVLISELSGRSAVLSKAREYRLGLEERSPEAQKILQLLKEMEAQGYQFEGAEASFELLTRKALGTARDFFELEGFRVIVDTRAEGGMLSEATVKLKVDGRKKHTAAEGNGPVNALDNALRKALKEFYPVLKDVRLMDYKVRVLDEK
ncbi:MAG: citramalate synthase, partial [Candidatus Hydrothermarchaeota archaeon]